MNLYKITASPLGCYGVYSGAVVCAESEDRARNTHPMTIQENTEANWKSKCWVNDPAFVEVQFLGQASIHIKPGVILADYYEG